MHETEGGLRRSVTSGAIVAGVPEIDSNRLYDPAYAQDEVVIAHAERLGIPPDCVIAIAKQAVDGVEISPDDCPSRSRPPIRDDPYAGHRYEQYSNQELEMLATAEPAAAVILARRLGNQEEARRWYERGWVLTGDTALLYEWVNYRGPGRLTWKNGVLDVDKAKSGYTEFVTIALLGGNTEGEVEMYAEALEKQGVDLDQLREQAAERARRLRAERDALFRHQEAQS